MIHRFRAIVRASNNLQMIGLKRHIVRVEDHDPDWLRLGKTICQEIRSVCEDLIIDLQHIGSTAIPDLPAKPIVDIVAGVGSPEVICDLIHQLTGIGYIYRGNSADRGGEFFVKESSPDVRTVHLHIVEYQGSQWYDYLLFRDRLRESSDIRHQYAGLKRDLAQKFAHDRTRYTAAKHAFIQNVLGHSR